MDDLVYICTKIARQMDVQGLDRVFDAAEAATAAVEEARPLLQRVVELVDEVRAGGWAPGCWNQGLSGAIQARLELEVAARTTPHRGTCDGHLPCLLASCTKPAVACIQAMHAEPVALCHS